MVFTYKNPAKVWDFKVSSKPWTQHTRMNFKIPDEYKDFVTPIDDLLNQFKNKETNGSNTNDHVTYYIYKDVVIDNKNSNHNKTNHCQSREDVLKEYIELYHKITTIITPLLKDYIWNYDNFQLTIQLDEDNHSIFLFGSTRIGQCIEDEWFIVYLLLIVSMKIDDISIHVMDNDGEFLVIEVYINHIHTVTYILQLQCITYHIISYRKHIKLPLL